MIRRRTADLVAARCVLATVLAAGMPAVAHAAGPVPRPGLDRAEPAVVRHVEAARDAVVADPAAAAWGRYARVLHAHGLLGEALVAYAEAARLDPQEPRWPHLAAVIHAEDDLDAALAGFDAALALAPGHAPAHVRRGLVLRALGRADEAAAAFARALELDPEYPSALIHLGQARVAARDAAGAIPLLERARALRPDDARILAALARARAIAGDRDEARRLAEAARGLEEGPDAEDPWLREVASERRTLLSMVRRVETLAAAGRIDQAVAAGRTAIAEGHDAGAIEATVARVLQAARRPAEALAASDRAIEAGRDGVAVRTVRAYALLDLGRRDEAQAAFAALVEADPDDPSIRRGAARLAVLVGDEAGALAHLEAIAASTRTAQDDRDRADRLRTLGRGTEALEALAPLLERERDAETLVVLGETLRTLGRPDEAFAAFEEADRTATTPRAGRRAALLVMQRGDWADALGRLRDLRRRFPAHPNVLNDLAWLLATCPDEALRNGTEAEGIVRPLVRATARRQPALLDTLAAALAAADRHAEATATIDEAIALLDPEGSPATLAAYRERRAAYAAGRPWTDRPEQD